jgi:hypothetical protein
LARPINPSGGGYSSIYLCPDLQEKLMPAEVADFIEKKRSWDQFTFDHKKKERVTDFLGRYIRSKFA